MHAKNVVDDQIKPLNPGDVSLHGVLGDNLKLSVKNRLKKVDYAHLVEPFRLRNERDGRWRCEFWGKIVRSAILSWRDQPDDGLLTIIKNTVKDIISTQSSDGCISTYPYELQTQDWDIWGRKYVLLGLARYYLEISPDEMVKNAMILQLDYLMTQVGPDIKNITACGHHNGMAASSILEPVVLTYRITGEKRFLDYALWIVEQGGSTVNNIFDAVKAGVPPKDLSNGKAYEMMSCFEGLAELYRTTGKVECLDSVLALYRAVRDQEIFITGVGGLKDEAGEYWNDGKIRQTQFNVGGLGETCVTTTWIKLCGQVLRLTGDSGVADEMERSLYNGILGAMVPDGSWWIHINPTPLAGAAVKRRAADQISGFGEDCCLAQGPKALAMAPYLAVMQHDAGPVINLYEAATAKIKLPDGTSTTLVINGDFPRTPNVDITVKLSGNPHFAIRLRMPGWSRNTRVHVNQQEYQGTPGSYLIIERDWMPGDVIRLEFDLSIRVVPAPDGGDRMAIMRGPVVLAQDSRLGAVDVPITSQAGKMIKSPDDIYLACQLEDGTALCDYASAGNQFSEENFFCVWMKRKQALR